METTRALEGRLCHTNENPTEFIKVLLVYTVHYCVFSDVGTCVCVCIIHYMQASFFDDPLITALHTLDGLCKQPDIVKSQFYKSLHHSITQLPRVNNFVHIPTNCVMFTTITCFISSMLQFHSVSFI